MGEITKKNRIVSGVLGVFLGALGIHNFYIGRNKRGLTQLLLTFLGVGLLVLSYIFMFFGMLILAFRGMHYYDPSTTLYGMENMGYGYQGTGFFGFFIIMIIFYILILISLILILGIALWGYIEGILILTGKIDKDGKGEALDNPVPLDQKSKMAAAMLGISLGIFGAHNFYLGNTGKAIAQILLTIVGGCIIVGPIIAFIWSLVESIQLFKGSVKNDGKGNPLYQD